MEAQAKETLFDITKRLQRALFALNEEEIDEESILALVEKVEGDMGDKIAKILAFMETIELTIAQQEAFRKHYAEKAAFWSKKRQVNENLRNRLEQYIISCMESVGITKHFQAGDHRVSIRKPAEVIKVTDVTLIPDRFFKHTEETLNRVEIKAALQAGEEVPGVVLAEGKKSLVLS